jgi:hypothetical protein
MTARFMRATVRQGLQRLLFGLELSRLTKWGGGFYLRFRLSDRWLWFRFLGSRLAG